MVQTGITQHSVRVVNARAEQMNREHNFAWSRDQLTKLLLHEKFENMCFHISKHVLSDIR
jgi:hypothetical protein